MAALLGLELEGSFPEFDLLWLAVEALRAPLPPLWHRVEPPPEEEDTPYYQHSVTFEQLDEHPLLP
eukprot:6463066-Prymnesium_polylepis.1